MSCNVERNHKKILRNLKRFRIEGYFTAFRGRTILDFVEFLWFLSTFQLIWTLFDAYRTFLRKNRHLRKFDGAYFRKRSAVCHPSDQRYIQNETCCKSLAFSGIYMRLLGKNYVETNKIVSHGICMSDSSIILSSQCQYEK